MQKQLSARARKAAATKAAKAAQAAINAAGIVNVPALPDHVAPAIVAPVTDAPATDAATDAAPATYRGLARDAATVVAQRTNFGEITDRDAAFRFFYGFTMRANGDTATLDMLHKAGTDAGNGKRRNPHYAGSAKATDAGAINRAVKAGYFTISESGTRLTATAKAKADRFYNGKQ